MEPLTATYETTEIGDILQKGDNKYIVIGKRAMMVVAIWPSQKNVTPYEQEEFDGMGFVKV